MNMFLHIFLLQESLLRFNGLTYKLDLSHSNSSNVKCLDCFDIDSFVSKDKSIEIKIASNSFISESKVLNFKDPENQRKLETFLCFILEERRHLPYKEKLCFFYLNREFDSLVTENEEELKKVFFWLKLPILVKEILLN